jgi:hypothetical protein
MKSLTASSQVRHCLWITLFVVFAFAPLAWSQSVVTCSSDDMHLHTCNIGPNRGVRMVRQRSGSACIQGRTYGVRGEQIWVDRGCRADFEVLAGGRGGYHDHDHDRDHDRDRDHYDRDRYDHDHGGGARIVTCSSDDGHRHTCDVGAAEGIRMVNQRSGSPCINGRTYGFYRGQIWVDRGCRADFEVRGRR